MREIRFRAWLCGECQKATSWKMEDDLNAFGDRGHTSVNEIISEYGCDKIMQFTGITDKNGNDIYEGDIVRASNPGLSWELGSVDFSLGKFMVHAMHLCELDCVVIGNIYENPELLKP